jgi:hypothetical protein
MELIFQTKNGEKLFATIKNDEIISLHSADSIENIKEALKADLYSKDTFAAYCALVLLDKINKCGVNIMGAA